MLSEDLTVTVRPLWILKVRQYCYFIKITSKTAVVFEEGTYNFIVRFAKYL